MLEIARVARLLDRGGGFAARWFSDAEISHCGPEPEGFATVLAAKEAAFKALGVPGDRAVPWRRIEVLPSGAGFDVTVDESLAPAGTRVLVDATASGPVAVAQAVAFSE